MPSKPSKTTGSKETRRLLVLRRRRRRKSWRLLSSWRRTCWRAPKGRARSWGSRSRTWPYPSSHCFIIKWGMGSCRSARNRSKRASSNPTTSSNRSKATSPAKWVIRDNCTRTNRSNLTANGYTKWPTWRAMTWRSTGGDLCLTSSSGIGGVCSLWKIMLNWWIWSDIVMVAFTI